MKTTNQFKVLALLGIITLIFGGSLSVTTKTTAAINADLRFEVHPQYDLVYAMGWDEGVELTLLVTDADGNFLTEITVTVGTAPWDPGLPAADFSLTGFDYQPTQILTASGDGMIKTFQIPDPIVSEINIDDNTVTGTGTPGARMLIYAGLPDQDFYRWTTIDVSGNWMVDFNVASDPGDTPGSMDLIPGTRGSADEFDDLDQTWADDWRAPAPFIQVNPVEDKVNALGMPVGTELTLTISETGAIVFTSEPTPIITDDMAAHFDLMGFDVKAGQLLSAGDGNITSTYTVSVFSIMDIDTVADTLSGIASPGGQVDICVSLPDHCAMRHLIADGSGNWVADFAHPGAGGDEQDTADIQPGSSGWGDEWDWWWDNTGYTWRIPRPIVSVNPEWNEVAGSGMPIGTVLTLTISEEGSVVFTSLPTPVDQNPDNPDDISARFDMMGFDVKVGQVLETSSADVSATYTVTVFAIMNIDPVSDTVAGISTPGATLQICANVIDHCAMRYPVADDDGNWIADFHVPGAGGNEQEIVDLLPGSGGWGNEHDFWGNQTWSAWYLANPRFDVRADWDEVVAWEWKIGEVLTLQVDGQEFTGTVTSAPWDVNLSYLRFGLGGLVDILPGDVITLTNDIVTKTTTVTELALTGFDVVHDVVYGKAAADSFVAVWVCDMHNCINFYRYLTADAEGNWKADYSIPGAGQGEQDTFDLIPTSWVDSGQPDADGDATLSGSYIPFSVFMPSIQR